MYNKELAGKEIQVAKDIVPEGKITFDEFGNVKEKISKEAEKKLTTIPGYHPGKSDAKKSLLAPPPEDKPANNSEEVEKLTEELEEVKAELEKVKGENESLANELLKAKEALKLAEAKAKVSEEKADKTKDKGSK